MKFSTNAIACLLASVAATSAFAPASLVGPKKAFSVSSQGISKPTRSSLYETAEAKAETYEFTVSLCCYHSNCGATVRTSSSVHETFANDIGNYLSRVLFLFFV